MKKISPIHVDIPPNNKKQLELKEEQIEKESSTILRRVLVFTIPYVLILPIFAGNVHGWYSTVLICLLVFFTFDLIAIAVGFYPILRPLSAFEAVSLTVILHFFTKYIYLKHETPISYLLFTI